MGVPRRLHQVWIGPDPAPREQIDSWRGAHPMWEHRLWREPGLDQLDWRPGCRRVYERYTAQGCWHGAVNVARVEILRLLGGVYCDADTTCLHPLDEDTEPPPVFADAPCWVAESPHQRGRPQNAFLAAPADHPVIDDYSRRLSMIGDGELHPSWRCTGALLLAAVMQDHPGEVLLVPSPVFHPYRMDGTPNPAVADYRGPIYARHDFYSTQLHRANIRV